MRLEIVLADSGSEYTLQGRVRFRRAGTREVEPGVSVAFEGDDKRLASEVLARWAGKDPRLGSASSVRRPTSIPCVVRLRDRRVVAEIKDLSSGGAFVTRSRAPAFPVGTEVVLQIEPIFSRWGGKRLAARVVWLGEKHGERGFGMRFVDEPARVQLAVGGYLARLRDA